jgi:hypothetical protein
MKEEGRRKKEVLWGKTDDSESGRGLKKFI